MDEGTKTCPRCGGAVHTLRRFTRLGRTVSVVVCRVCRYTEFAAGSRSVVGRQLSIGTRPRAKEAARSCENSSRL